MLARRREQILIIGGLIGLNILLGWFLEQHRKDYRSRTQWVYAKGSLQPPATSAAGLNQEAGHPQSFVEIVDRNVFSPLRGHPPPAPPEAAKPPKPPLLYGTMNLGNGWFALMAPGDQPSPASKRVLPGEEIGGYKLVSIGTSNVVIEWQEKRINLDISDAVRQASIEKTASTGSRPAAVTTAGTASNPVTSVSPKRGSGGFIPPARSASPADSPNVQAGAIVDGKQKVVVQTPFGTTVHWVPAGSPDIPAQQTGAPNK